MKFCAPLVKINCSSYKKENDMTSMYMEVGGSSYLTTSAMRATIAAKLVRFEQTNHRTIEFDVELCVPFCLREEEGKIVKYKAQCTDENAFIKTGIMSVFIGSFLADVALVEDNVYYGEGEESGMVDEYAIIKFRTSAGEAIFPVHNTTYNDTAKGIKVAITNDIVLVFPEEGQ
jgi:hypothetical protein